MIFYRAGQMVMGLWTPTTGAEFVEKFVADAGIFSGMYHGDDVDRHERMFTITLYDGTYTAYCQGEKLTDIPDAAMQATGRAMFW